MTRASRSTRELLTEAEVHLQLAQSYASGSVDEQVVVDAICMRLSAGIESLSRLDPAVRNELFGRSWAAMWGMRNRIAHGYLLVDSVIVRSTADRDVPVILNRVREALEQSS